MSDNLAETWKQLLGNSVRPPSPNALGANSAKPRPYELDRQHDEADQDEHAGEVLVPPRESSIVPCDRADNGENCGEEKETIPHPTLAGGKLIDRLHCLDHRS